MRRWWAPEAIRRGFLFGSNDVMNSLLGINQEMQFNDTLAPFATHAAYLEYTGTALREKQNVLVAIACPQEMKEDDYWENIDSFVVGSGGSSDKQTIFKLHIAAIGKLRPTAKSGRSIHSRNTDAIDKLGLSASVFYYL